MFNNYWKTAFRFLFRNKAFSLINILGLSLGTLCCLYIVLYVADQYNYDRQHRDVKDIYRITSFMQINGNSPIRSGFCSPPVAPAMKRDFGEVVQYTRVLQTDGFGATEHLMRYKDKSFYEEKAAYADSTFFDVFSYHFQQGSPEKALTAPYSIVLLEPVAVKLFGAESAVGKVITIDDTYGKHDFTVTAVVDESLGRSHLQANYFMSMNSGGMGEFVYRSQSWAGQNMTLSYVRLNPGANAASLEARLPAFVAKYGADQLKSLGMTKQLHLQPMQDIHTTTGYANDAQSVGSSFLSLLLLIAGLIQLIACINFMNLSTARASRRAMEVAVRKVIGAEKGQLIAQFLGESLLVTLFSVLLAVPVLILFLPLLNGITHASITPGLLLDYRVLLFLLSLILVTGLLAGSYPALYLSGFRVIRVIKGNLTNHISAAGIRKGLVVFQFVLSIVLISGVIVIYGQLNYIKNRDLGFDKDQKLVFSFFTDTEKQQVAAFADAMRRIPGVKVVSMANNFLGRFVPNSWVYSTTAGGGAAGQEIKMMFTDENFMKAGGLRLVAGRDFLKSDSAKVVVNETLVRRLGLTNEKALGVRLYPQQDAGEKPTWMDIVGVMKDFNYSSLHEAVEPFMLRYADAAVKEAVDTRAYVTVSASSADYRDLLQKIEGVWGDYFHGTPFQYQFMDEVVQKQYTTEETLSRIIICFTGMAILISCLGLFGLAAFSAEQRQKEIGIRKVLGASVSGIVRLLSVDFLSLVMLALLVATPISWWVMTKWLQGFVYRVSLSWWMFALAGTLALLIALLTVGMQAVRAAVMNPIKSLRSE